MSSYEQKEREKIYKIRDQLLITYKASTNEEQKKRINSYLRQIENIIKKLESGNWVNPIKLKILSEKISNNQDLEKIEEDTQESYKNKIEIKKISELNKDPEIDEIYSYFLYFENNLRSPLSLSNLKIDYSLSKIRDDFFVRYDNVLHLLEELKSDIELLAKITNKGQIEIYKERLKQQKRHLLFKISEMLNELKNFLEKVITDIEEGRKSLFNPNEKYIIKFDTSKRSLFEGKTYKEIVFETYNFVNDFIDILRMPYFKNK